MLEIRVLPSSLPSGPGRVEPRGEVETVVKVTGRLDRFSAGTFGRGMASIPGSIRLDCSDLHGIDSTGFAALVALHEACSARGDRLVASGLVTPPREEWASWPGLETLDLDVAPGRAGAERVGV